MNQTVPCIHFFPIDTYFKLFKKSFDLTKTRIKSGYKGGSKKKKEITY